ncbi:T9SS type A sorting domain-containing protein [Winogradskyella jejuensis]|uniref:Por secretion system C-terminal sorting domain-containing protein n=1 Tax=Winogradskyella jejuensis TaxID=1089305 RepID=A0A1M5JL83_9FLAO|nr:T9SS type A sorting domain-containing protein [Winogradskyella jejuensis]SHG40783.1 Por secretion system C-terminal sorting domain-containing protein [Winogradskyella jejuensis]
MSLNIFPKQILLTAVVCLLNLTIYGQSNECGFQYTPEAQQYFNSIRQKIKPLEQEFIQQRLSSNSTVITAVPIKAHIIRRTDGTGGLTVTELNDAITDMNAIYVDAGLEFFLCDGVNFIDNDNFYSYETDDETQLFDNHSQANIMNIYFANSVTSSSNGGSLCGYARFPGPAITENILMANGCATNGSTLSHEVGHFFALSHTHGNINTPGSTNELVDGSNCDSTGDFICDTPADPQLGYGNVNSSCIYTGSTQDANNDFYAPDPENLMSYSRKECRTQFSTQQLARINAIYQTSRNNLSCPSFNADFTADQTQSCNANLTVNFTNTSTSATSWSWDVDGDNIEDYNTQNVTHTYNVAGDYDVALTISNGVNSISKMKSNYIDVGAPEINTATIELTLTLDDWPDETTWQFLGESGAVLYSGGPYIQGTDDFTTKVETFNIDPSSCYSFVIADAYGDGICCAEGNGSYELRADDNSLIASGGSYGFGTTDNFRNNNNSLNIDVFTISTIKLFPNPSSGILNIQSEYLPDSYSIINTLGQVLRTSKVGATSEFSVDISELKEGLYFIKLTKGNANQILSFIRN